MNIRGGGVDDPKGSPTTKDSTGKPSSPKRVDQVKASVPTQDQGSDVQDNIQNRTDTPEDVDKVQAPVRLPKDSDQDPSLISTTTPDDVDEVKALVHQPKDVDQDLIPIHPTAQDDVDGVQAPVHQTRDVTQDPIELEDDGKPRARFNPPIKAKGDPKLAPHKKMEPEGKRSPAKALADSTTNLLTWVSEKDQGSSDGDDKLDTTSEASLMITPTKTPPSRNTSDALVPATMVIASVSKGAMNFIAHQREAILNSPPARRIADGTSKISRSLRSFSKQPATKSTPSIPSIFSKSDDDFEDTPSSRHEHDSDYQDSRCIFQDDDGIQPSSHTLWTHQGQPQDQTEYPTRR